MYAINFVMYDIIALLFHSSRKMLIYKINKFVFSLPVFSVIIVSDVKHVLCIECFLETCREKQ